MKKVSGILPFLAALSWACAPPAQEPSAVRSTITPVANALHGYISFSASPAVAPSEYGAGVSFYTAVWPLVDEPLARFQVGLAGTWIIPDNSDNKDTPLAPVGTYARNHMPERGPTYETVFQTVEGGTGYWAGNRFRYGPPKFSMNATPQCYDYSIASPGWPFFSSDQALPDSRLGIAQLSNRLLVPPDGLPFQGQPNGQFLGLAYMALPFTDPVDGDPPTGDQSWTCFLSTANFKGPLAFYIPETWSKIGKLFSYPFVYGRGLDARAGKASGGAMEINTVPGYQATDSRGIAYTRLPKLQFPVDDRGRTILVQDMTYYARAALHDAFKAWRDGGRACAERFDEAGAWRPALKTQMPSFDMGGKKVGGLERTLVPRVFEPHVWGLEWVDGTRGGMGSFPRYFQHVGDGRLAVADSDVPVETGLAAQTFVRAGLGGPYTSPAVGAWGSPGPVRGPFLAHLADGSTVTWSWYRFVDQPSFQQYAWSAEKKARLQAFVEEVHAAWSIDRDYMAPLRQGALVSMDPALFVTPPPGLEVGYVPIVTRQEATAPGTRAAQ
ncbi:MAG: hypothetical protein MUF66_14820 [Gammaproteobacteria bacterium]|nr:hypothetical protein [Gammaproteobacteria bacterium]